MAPLIVDVKVKKTAMEDIIVQQVQLGEMYQCPALYGPLWGDHVSDSFIALVECAIEH